MGKTLFWKSAGVLLVAAVAILLAAPKQPELDWDGVIVPLAQDFSGSDSKTKPLKSKNILITGSTSGIGLSLTRALSKLGATVIGLGRSQKKLDSLQKEIPSVRAVRADLGDLLSVAAAADEIIGSFHHIDILIINAGMTDGLVNLFGQTDQGYNRVFMVNYLSHFLLTEKLAGLISSSERPIIVQISSSFHWAVDGSDLMPQPENGLLNAAAPGGSHGFYLFRSQRSYANSKLAQIYHARALKQQHPALSQARIVSVCPAWVGTNLAGSGSFVHYMMNTLGYPMEGWGIASTFHAMFSFEDDEKDSNDDFYTNTRAFDIFHYIFANLPCWSYKIGLRDLMALLFASFGMVAQRFVPYAGPSRSSPESYNETIRDALYDWSHEAIAGYL